MSKKVILVIMDGWGLGQVAKADAIQHAHVPFVTSLYQQYPNTTLVTCGEEVGLPDGQMGNSEVGHLNLGAGRIVYQELQRINVAIKTGEFASQPTLLQSIRYAKENNKPLHLIGLVSDGGVHAHTAHLKALCDLCKAEGLTNVFIHAFTDGRDTDPKSGQCYVESLETHLKKSVGKIASVSGRYYAMDRDKRWERIKIAYDALVNGKGEQTSQVLKAIESSYEEGITDEFIKPIVNTDKNGNPVTTIKEDDVIIFFNFRTDRGRQLTEVLSQNDFHEFGMHKLNLHYVTLTNYDENFKDINVVFNKNNLTGTLGEILEKYNKKQIRIAETEKYPHVTFFFSGGQEEPFKGETRLLRSSPKVATYDLKPEMSAYELRDALVPELKKGDVDFVCLNFANGDMVGHTGDMGAAIKACEAVDTCVEAVITTALEHNYTTLLIADHGNCETMINPDGSPNTAHTTNPVPIILIDKELTAIKDGVLGDIAPTVLKLIGIEKPEVMTQSSLI